LHMRKESFEIYLEFIVVNIFFMVK
jgi:hypothetical protein